MAQAGYTPISLYYSTTAAAVPLAANLAQGELAINIADGKLYYENSSGAVTLLASAAGASGDVVGPASATDNAVARFDGTTGKLIQNGVVIIGDTGAVTGVTDLTASGSVTLSGGTANGVAYLNGSKVVTSGSALNYAAGTGVGNLLEVTGGSNNVNGQINIQGTDGTNTSFVSLLSGLEPTNLPSLFFSNGLRFALATNKAASGYSEQMRLTSTGLGIGTSSPAYKLDSRVTTSASVVSAINLDASGNNNGDGSALNFSRAGNALSGVARISAVKAEVSNNETDLVFSNFAAGSLTEKMRIVGATGNVGIGTSSPAAKLHIAVASAAVDGTKGVRITNPAGTIAVFECGSAGDSFIGTTSGSDFNIRTNNTVRATFDNFGNITNTRSIATAYSGSNSATWTNGLFMYNTATPAVGIANLIQFGNSANVNSIFGVVQNASGYGDFVWAGYNGAFTEFGRFTSAGNFGIGTSSPGQKLDVDGNIRSRDGGLSLSVGTAQQGVFCTYNRIFGSGTDYTPTIFAETGLGITFAVNGSATKAMTLNSSGNFGIGTSSPATKLEINGNGELLRFDGSSGQDRSVYFRNVGSGKTAKILTDGTLALETNSTTSITFATNSAERARIDTSGRLLVGTTVAGSGGIGVTVYSPSQSEIRLQNSTTGTGDGAGFQMAIDSTSGYLWNINSGIIFGGNSLERMRIDTSGNLLVGTTSTVSSEKFNLTTTIGAFTQRIYNSSASTPFGIYVSYSAGNPNNTSSEFFRGDSSAGIKFQAMSNGGVANFSGNNINLSDRREKTNFAPAKSYLDVICAIPVQTYNYIDQNLEEDDGLTLGVVAQDVQAVAPELVMESNWAKEGDEPKMRLSIYQTDLQYALMKCIQEQQAIINSLKARLDAANL